MCGIFAAVLSETGRTFSTKLYSRLSQDWSRIAHRGPDRGRLEYVVPKTVLFGFHRLCINGLDRKSDQPLVNPKGNISLICNGEIYNTKLLAEEHKLNCRTNSDCEVIIHLYERFGIQRTVDMLDGVFAFVLYDRRNNTLIAARDVLGIRPLFLSSCDTANNVSLGLASEAKCLTEMSSVAQFPPGTWKSWTIGMKHLVPSCSGTVRLYLRLVAPKICDHSNKSHQTRMRELLHEAVRKRLLLSDRPVGCLLSGGLDSTLVSAILVKELASMGKPSSSLHTYSVGLSGSVDLRWARAAAKHLGTTHHEICLTEEQFLEAIPRTVWYTESFDTTTIRASTGNLLVSEYIRDNSQDVVIFVGDVSDEIFASYRGFCKAPDSDSFFKANYDMLFDIHHYDVLRSDRSISAAGLEARVPFADLDVLRFVMSLPPSVKQFDSKKMEKLLLREAFEGYLPSELLYRRKEAFSDGVSSEKRDWFTIIREKVSTMYTTEDLAQKNKQLPPGVPLVPDIESLWYRELYDKHFGNCMPNPLGKSGYWRHPFCGKDTDPSARLLDCY